MVARLSSCLEPVRVDLSLCFRVIALPDCPVFSHFLQWLCCLLGNMNAAPHAGVWESCACVHCVPKSFQRRKSQGLVQARHAGDWQAERRHELTTGINVFCGVAPTKTAQGMCMSSQMKIRLGKSDFLAACRHWTGMNCQSNSQFHGVGSQ